MKAAASRAQQRLSDQQPQTNQIPHDDTAQAEQDQKAADPSFTDELMALKSNMSSELTRQIESTK